MKQLLTSVLLVGALGATAQVWCPPGAVWTYRDESWFYDIRSEHRYLGDTVIDGLAAKRIQVRRVGHDWNTPVNSTTTEHTALVGNVLLARVGPVWDTLYWFGVPGDRWWPIGAQNEACAPYGMLEVADTGRVEMGGLSLATWGIRYMAGGELPSGGGFMITERIGAVPRMPFLVDCEMIVDYATPSLVCYSDNEISTSGNEPCSLTLSAPEVDMERGRSLIRPNPAEDRLWVEMPHAAPGAWLIVRDMQGRTVLERRMRGTREELDIAHWGSGAYVLEVTNPDKGGQRTRFVKR